MIECELCGESFNEEEMRECPECLKVMCEECYERHMSVCFYVSQEGDMDTYDE